MPILAESSSGREAHLPVWLMQQPVRSLHGCGQSGRSLCVISGEETENPAAGSCGQPLDRSLRGSGWDCNLKMALKWLRRVAHVPHLFRNSLYCRQRLISLALSRLQGTSWFRVFFIAFHGDLEWLPL